MTPMSTTMFLLTVLLPMIVGGVGAISCMLYIWRKTGMLP